MILTNYTGNVKPRKICETARHFGFKCMLTGEKLVAPAYILFVISSCTQHILGLHPKSRALQAASKAACMPFDLLKSPKTVSTHAHLTCQTNLFCWLVCWFTHTCTRAWHSEAHAVIGRKTENHLSSQMCDAGDCVYMS